MAHSIADARFQLPCNFHICGPTGAGKSTWLYYLLEKKDEHLNFQQETGGKIVEILYCTGSGDQPLFDKFKENLNVKFYTGMPTNNFLDNFFENDNQLNYKIIIFDDLMEAFNKKSGHLLTSARHSNVSVFCLEQNVFCEGKNGPTIRRNMHVKVIFPFKQDLNSVKLCIQKSIGDLMKTKEIFEIYKNITKNNPHGYLVIDLNNKGNPLLMFRTDVLMQEKNHCRVFAPIEDLVT